MGIVCCSKQPETSTQIIKVPDNTIIKPKLQDNIFIKLRELGKGGFGKVFLIQSKKTEKEYALKEITIEKQKSKDLISIKREINNLRILDHPNIISIKVAFLSNNEEKVCIITDYAEGGDLEKEFEKHQNNKNYFEEKILLNWIFQVCLALQYSHDEKNIIHRDIKPLNIFLMKNGTVKVGDLGLSKQLSKYSLYFTKTKLGTRRYLAPEIINLDKTEREEGYSFKADIWSLGVTFCQLMSLEIPFEIDVNKYENIIKKIKNPKILNNDKSNYNDDIINHYSKEFLELIDWMLTINPIQRPTARQILQKDIIRKRMNSFLQENKFNSDEAINEINNYIEKEKEKVKDFENKEDDLDIIIEDIGLEDICNEKSMKAISAQEDKIKYDFFRQMSLIDESLKKLKTCKQNN